MRLNLDSPKTTLDIAVSKKRKGADIAERLNISFNQLIELLLDNSEQLLASRSAPHQLQDLREMIQQEVQKQIQQSNVSGQQKIKNARKKKEGPFG